MGEKLVRQRKKRQLRKDELFLVTDLEQRQRIKMPSAKMGR